MIRCENFVVTWGQVLTLSAPLVRERSFSVPSWVQLGEIFSEVAHLFFCIWIKKIVKKGVQTNQLNRQINNQLFWWWVKWILSPILGLISKSTEVLVFLILVHPYDCHLSKNYKVVYFSKILQSDISGIPTQEFWLIQVSIKPDVGCNLAFGIFISFMNGFNVSF